MQQEIETNETTISENDKNVESLKKERTDILNTLELQEKSGVYDADPGDPQTGLAIAQVIHTTIQLVKYNKAGDQIEKLDNTSGNLKTSNKIKNAQIGRLRSILKPKKLLQPTRIKKI